MRYLSSILNKSADFAALRQSLTGGVLSAAVTGLSQVHKAHLCYSLCEETGRKLLYIAADDSEARKLQEALEPLFGGGVLLYPARELIFHSIESVSREWAGERLRVLLRLQAGSYKAVITTPDAAMQFTLPPEKLKKYSKTVKMGRRYDLAELTAFLTEAGYSRCEQVEGAGQFALRGGILDFFPPDSSEPFRIEFFGDEPDLISHFDVLTQRRNDKLQEARISPALETVLDAADRERFKRELADMADKASHSRKEVSAAAEKVLRADLERFSETGSLPNMEKYLPVLFPPATLFDYLQNGYVAASETGRMQERIRTFLWQQEEDVKDALMKGLITERTAEHTLDSGGFWHEAAAKGLIYLNTLPRTGYEAPPRSLFSFTAKQLSGTLPSTPLLVEDLKAYLSTGFEVAVACSSERRAQNLSRILSDSGVRCEVTRSPERLPKQVVRILDCRLPAGMEYPDLRFVIFTDGGVGTEQTPVKKRAGKKKAGEALRSFSDLHPGDLVVHTSYGIGQYVGLSTLTVEGVSKDYIKIRYSGDDYLYVPSHQLDLISKYVAGGDGSRVKLNKMGGGDWQKTKSRVRKAVQDMAKQLIELYASRQRLEGYAFAPDNEWQREFEESFEFEETDDQLKCIREIKADMERAVPMDRLLCGDVGFGKTEVALRAAFKAVMSGRQVAILVPTTILAWQHFETIRRRMQAFPVKVEVLSRFRTPKQQTEIIKQVKRGEVDIVVGTHRLIQKDVKFDRLGLVVVDEEQRFGVAHKEKLKELIRNVDALTLTATPIPRTLNMAMTGIRDMSVIEDPPRDRQAVQTYVLEHDPGVLLDALRRELRRGGQVFYLHNRVESIDRVAGKLKAQLPDARIAVAHGKMGEDELSDVWTGLVNAEVDILVCTTIIETGVDVPNANTLVIEDADHLGLAQLYQIRGRVGRSSRRAYAYFTYRKGKALSEDATKRLSTIREFTEFGSGFKIALRDLEIRGAGNVLGAEQHGQLEAVGYDMYLRLLEEAVLQEKGESPELRTDCVVDLFVDTHIPERYIKSTEARIDIYKKIAALRTEEDADDLRDELLDRFGDLPKPVEHLCDIALIRNMASRCGVSEMTQKGDSLLLYLTGTDFERISRVTNAFKGRVLYNAGQKPYISLKIRKGEDVLSAAKAVVQALFGNNS